METETKPRKDPRLIPSREPAGKEIPSRTVELDVSEIAIPLALRILAAHLRDFGWISDNTSDYSPFPGLETIFAAERDEKRRGLMADQLCKLADRIERGERH